MANETPQPVEEEIATGTTTANTKERKDRDNEDDEFDDDATWGEVCQACCVHSPTEWSWVLLGLFLVCFFLYWFLFGLELLGSGAKVMCGCRAGALFGEDTNPVAGLMVGILATVLLQSSSTTTSIIVSLVGSAINVEQGIYMVMGANIGTSVTNTIVAMGQMGDGEQLERAFAGATVHDMFNFMTVAILLPIEAITGYLDRITSAIIKGASPGDAEKWEGPVKKIVSPLGDLVIKSNKSLIKAIANNKGSCAEGDGFYPIVCENRVVSDSTCTKGLIDCDGDTDKCPAFFQQDATAADDKVSGGVVFFIAICILFTCLLGLVAVLQKMLLGMSTRVIYKATDVNGYIAIAVGAGITVLVQSSSITTSTLTPLVGMGALRLEQMYPLTLGANIGTTMTGIMAAMVASEKENLQVALAHLFFNITGIILFYPIPFMRSLPLHAARRLGKATRVWRGFPLVYIFTMFVVVPMIFLGLSFLFEKDVKGYTVLGSFLTVLIFCILMYIAYWCRFQQGQQKCTDCMVRRERKRLAIEELPEDMEFLKTKMALLLEHNGLQDNEKADKTDKVQGSSSDDEVEA